VRLKISTRRRRERAQARSQSLRHQPEVLHAGDGDAMAHVDDAQLEASLLDLRELEAPLPLERILEASAGLAPGDSVLARTPSFPRPLFTYLDDRDLDWEALEESDGTALVYLRKPLRKPLRRPGD